VRASFVPIPSTRDGTTEVGGGRGNPYHTMHSVVKKMCEKLTTDFTESTEKTNNDMRENNETNMLQTIMFHIFVS